MLLATKEKRSKVKDKTVYKSLGLSGGIFGAAPCAVDVKDGKIVRIRPLHYDSKYDPKQFRSWEIKRNGKSLKPMMKAPLSLQPGLQEKGLLSQQNQISLEAGGLGSGR